MSWRKPMGCYWAILAVRDEFLSGGRRILLAKIFLLDNGSRGCTAPAALLGRYTGLTERTVDKYRREFEAQCLLFPVAGTHGWHMNLPTGSPPDRATDAEIQAYALRIEAQIGVRETTPHGGANHTQECVEKGPKAHPRVRIPWPTTEADTAGLMSTQDTHDKCTREYDASHLATHEKGGFPRSSAVERWREKIVDPEILKVLESFDLKRETLRGPA